MKIILIIEITFICIKPIIGQNSIKNLTTAETNNLLKINPLLDYHAIIEQHGDYNDAYINQVSYYNFLYGYASIHQYGDYNNASIMHAGDANIITIEQFGNLNSANVNINGSKSHSTISQNSDNNHVELNMHGDNNNSNISQLGNDNYVNQTITGSNLDLMIEQTGNNNSITQTQDMPIQLPMTIRQFGSRMKLIISNGNILNTK